jgi:pimeloyl-ACP methyl ester carboxylesterase
MQLARMGSLFFGGSVSRQADGETVHGDHGYAQYFIPEQAREFPLVMWHGVAQSAKTWESTPDGRDGYLQIFTRRRWPVYLMDQPRRGRAGRTLSRADDGTFIPTLARESEAWNTFRLGLWLPPDGPSFYPGLQFPQDAHSISQFFRQSTPDTGPEPFPDAAHREFLADAVVQLLRQSGPAVLVTHSHSGQYGWVTAMQAPDLVKAVVAYEPAEFAFPEGEEPPHIATTDPYLPAFMAPQYVTRTEFLKLTRIPLLIVYGDNISKTPCPVFGVELWRMALERARQFVECVNRHGGDAQLVYLPDIGIVGNTHFPFADLNNVQIADHLEAFLRSKQLDR